MSYSTVITSYRELTMATPNCNIISLANLRLIPSNLMDVALAIQFRNLLESNLVNLADENVTIQEIGVM